MATIQGENAVQRLSAVMQNRDNPDDPGLLAEAGLSLDEVFERMRAHVERTDKACTGNVVITLKLKAYRSKGGEVAVDVEAGVASKSPAPAKRETQLFLDREGLAHTTPQQEDLPMFDKKSARVVPGVGNDDAAKAGKPAVKVV